MTRQPELPETQAILARIKAGEPISILVGEGHEAVQMVLTPPAQEWLRRLFVKITEPVAGAGSAHRAEQHALASDEGTEELKDEGQQK